MNWGIVIKNFQLQQKVLKEGKKEVVTETPKRNKTLVIINWSKDFANFLSRVIDMSVVSLSCVIRDNAALRGVFPLLDPNGSHSEECFQQKMNWHHLCHMVTIFLFIIMLKYIITKRKLHGVLSSQLRLTPTKERIMEVMIGYF